MPYDDKTGGAEYAESVRDVLRHAASADAAAAQRQEPRSTALTTGPALVVLAVVFGAVLVYNVRSFSRQPEPLPPDAAQMSVAVTVMIASQAVEAFREEHGRLPESLEEVGFPEAGLVYRVTGDSYELTVSQGETSVELRPSDDPLAVLEELRVTLPPEGAPGGSRR